MVGYTCVIQAIHRNADSILILSLVVVVELIPHVSPRAHTVITPIRRLAAEYDDLLDYRSQLCGRGEHSLHLPPRGPSLSALRIVLDWTSNRAGGMEMLPGRLIASRSLRLVVLVVLLA